MRLEHCGPNNCRSISIRNDRLEATAGIASTLDAIVVVRDDALDRTFEEQEC